MQTISRIEVGMDVLISFNLLMEGESVEWFKSNAPSGICTVTKVDESYLWVEDLDNAIQLEYVDGAFLLDGTMAKYVSESEDLLATYNLYESDRETVEAISGVATLGAMTQAEALKKIVKEYGEGQETGMYENTYAYTAKRINISGTEVAAFSGVIIVEVDKSTSWGTDAFKRAVDNISKHNDIGSDILILEMFTEISSRRI